MKASIVLEIFQRFKQHNPTPTTELNYTTPFELLIAVVLSAQATDIRVNIVTQQLFSLAKSPETMVELGEKKIARAIQSLGLYRNKAKNVYALSQQLITNHHSQVPNHYESLIKLPGVGRKTANVILNTYYHAPTIAVDTHVYRVSKRIGLVSSQANTPLAVEKKLLATIPTEYLYHAHHWLILHGRYICMARKPKCRDCFIRDCCRYQHKCT
ncbi:MAG: endonuclease III [Legionellales bacterium]|nr:endonuclease III [Legionellales bacterium]